jgi:hypothetical protein
MLADVARGGRADRVWPDREWRTAVDPVGW